MIYVIAIFGLTIIAAVVFICYSIRQYSEWILFSLITYKRFGIGYPQWNPGEVIELRHSVELTENAKRFYGLSQEEVIARIDRDAIWLLNSHVEREVKIWMTGHDPVRQILTRHYYLRILKKR